MASQTILHPTDFLENSEAAFAFASELAPLLDAKLLIVHVVPPIASQLAVGGVAAGYPAVGATPAATSSAMMAIGDELQERLRQLTPDNENVEFERMLVEGDPAQEIVDLAKVRNVSQIIMGSHGRTGLTRVLVGSVAEAVLRHAPCPVTVVKSQNAASQA